MRKIELLAPAKNLQSGMSAVDYGADALYAGGPAFGARHGAANTMGDLGRLIEYAHLYGVRVYAALNTLVYEHELADARKVAGDCIAAGIDALIVQDMAFLRMGLPPVEFHASTQTSNTDPAHVRFLREAGFARVILERGLTLGQIRDIRSQTDGVGLECFVHGAICVAQSGRCYMSRTMGTRSGNRGDCMQACRLTYDLEVDGKPVLKNKHLLSVRDLDLSARIGDLIDAGVDSFKIEGRLKDENYVKNTVAHYRRVLDSVIGSREGLVRSSSGTSGMDFTPDPRKTFSRGFTQWAIEGIQRGAADFDSPKSTGEFIGTVVRKERGAFYLSPGHERLAAGDGICFYDGSQLCGTNVNSVNASGGIVPNSIAGIERGVKIYRNFDHRFNAMLASGRTKRHIDTEAVVQADGNSVTLILKDADGYIGTALLDGPFEPAKDPLRSENTVRTQIMKSGDSAFRISGVRIEGAGMPFLPVSKINELRRGAVRELETARRNSLPNYDLRSENTEYAYPYPGESALLNITNSLAERFYRDHGVEDIAVAPDLMDSLEGVCVMQTPYCLRRETGNCPGQGAGPNLSDWFIERGFKRYRLEFDCRRCLMKIYYCGEPTRDDHERE